MKNQLAESTTRKESTVLSSRMFIAEVFSKSCWKAAVPLRVYYHIIFSANVLSNLAAKAMQTKHGSKPLVTPPAVEIRQIHVYMSVTGNVFADSGYISLKHLKLQY
jgi:hypothetical protein